MEKVSAPPTTRTFFHSRSLESIPCPCSCSSSTLNCDVIGYEWATAKGNTRCLVIYPQPPHSLRPTCRSLSFSWKSHHQEELPRNSKLTTNNCYKDVCYAVYDAHTHSPRWSWSFDDDPVKIKQRNKRAVAVAAIGRRPFTM